MLSRLNRVLGSKASGHGSNPESRLAMFVIQQSKSDVNLAGRHIQMGVSSNLTVSQTAENRKITMDGGQGYRSLYLAHAKRALYHLS